MVDEFDDVPATLAVDEHQEAARAVRRRDDGVHLVVSEPASVLRSRGTILNLEPTRHRLRRMGFRAAAVALVGMVGRRAVGDADIVGVDVLVPGRDARDALVRQLLRHDTDGVVGGQLLVDHVFLEEKRHLIRHQHLRTLVRVVLVDLVLCGHWIVFGVFPATLVFRVGNGDSGGSAVVFASLGLRPQAVLGRELADRDLASGPDELVPVCGERQTLLDCQECSWGVLCDILSHGVLSWLMIWIGNLHLTKDCDAFVAFCARDDP